MGIALEARETAAGARRQLASAAVHELAARLRARPPALIVTCARGSSDHAATYGKYVLEAATGCVVASAAPSIASIYNRSLRLDGALVIAVSQSGRTPDVLELVRGARAAGAVVAAIVNAEGSPLGAEADVAIVLGGGPEHAIAATKSFLLSCLAFVQIAAAWSGERELVEAVARAPDVFDAACELAWDLTPLAPARSLYVVARGPGFGAAQEVALKLKETCRLHAEAFSSAEVMHGPIALVTAQFPILALTQADATLATTHAALERLVGLGANVLATTELPGAVSLPRVANVPPLLAPLAAVQSCYLALPALAAARGCDADAPAHLRKVTETR